MTSVPLPSRHLRHVYPVHHDPQSAGWALAQAEEKERAGEARLARRHNRLHVAGRTLMAALFLASGLAKLFEFDSTLKALDTFALGDSALALSVAIVAELLGGSLLLLGYQTRWASLSLAAYVALTTVFFHWDVTDAVHRAFALSNLAVIGGLLLLVAHGAGAASIERRIERKDPNRLPMGP